MSTLEHFMAYAGAFEKTLADDDWERVRPWFDDASVYRVESGVFGCELAGADAILAGMKKSLDGFDRYFDSRDVRIDEGPEVEGGVLRMKWTVIYHKDGLPDCHLHGRSRAEFRDGVIALLVDAYEPAAEAEVGGWMAQNGVQLDPSYT